MKMYALLTTQGTAIADTAICERHVDNASAGALAVGTAHQFHEDWDEIEDFTDCTSNDELRCQICGWPEPEDVEKLPEHLRNLRKPDGSRPTAEEISIALYETTKAEPNQMDCPVLECGGHIEAAAGIWFDISPDGVPYTACITWREGGKIYCSRGGQDHIDRATKDRLWDTFQQYAATAEERLGASNSEDAIKDKWRLSGA